MKRKIAGALFFTFSGQIWSLTPPAPSYGIRASEVSEVKLLVNARARGAFAFAGLSLIEENPQEFVMFGTTNAKRYMSGEWPEWVQSSGYANDRSTISKLNLDSSGHLNVLTMENDIFPSIRNGKQIFEEAACANSTVKYGAYYYTYFENMQKGTGLCTINVARRLNLVDVPEVLTTVGWRLMSEASGLEWKPIIQPGILNHPQGRAIVNSLKTDVGNQYWGNGAPVAYVYNNKIHLQFLDTTYYAVDEDSNLPKRKADGTLSQIPYSLLAVSTNGSDFVAPVGVHREHNPANKSAPQYPTLVEDTRDPKLHPDGVEDLWDSGDTKVIDSPGGSLNNKLAMFYLSEDKRTAQVRISDDGVVWRKDKRVALFSSDSPLSGSFGFALLKISSSPEGKISLNKPLHMLFSSIYKNLVATGPAGNPFYTGGHDLFTLNLKLNAADLNKPALIEVKAVDVQESPRGAYAPPVLIYQTNRYQSQDSASGFYACGTGFTKQANLALTWIAPDGVRGNPVWYLNNAANPNLKMSFYLEKSRNPQTLSYLSCAFIPLSANTQELFNQGWKAEAFIAQSTTGKKSATLAVSPMGFRPLGDPLYKEVLSAVAP